jgi:hypothetical protein
MFILKFDKKEGLKVLEVNQILAAILNLAAILVLELQNIYFITVQSIKMHN